MFCPVMYSAASDVRNATTSATSSGNPPRPRGTTAPASGFGAAWVEISPGDTTFTRTPSGAHSRASCWHNAISAAFAAGYAPFPGCGTVPDTDPMAMNDPRVAARYGYAALA